MILAIIANMVNPRQWLVYAATLMCLLGTTSIFSAVVVDAGSDWRYFKGRTEASSPDRTSWRNLAFNDAAWVEAPAPFFYGDPFTPGTVVNDMQSQYNTLFFRKKIQMGPLSTLSSAEVDVLCDDGFILWINGKKVANIYDPPEATFFSNATQATPTDPAIFVTYPIEDPRSVFVEGENILAVQVFNASSASTDIAFDLKLFTTRSEPGVPYLVNVSPFPGTVTTLTEVTVEFNENVVGVDAGDLLVNQLPAASVVGSGNRYTFGFLQPGFGTVQFAWAPNHEIRDLDLPANLFDRNRAESTFSFELADPTSPLISEVKPPSGVVIRKLNTIEILFSKPVLGVDAGDLLINGSAARTVSGVAAGPYVFEFAEPGAGTVQVTWAANNGILDALDPQKKAVLDALSYTRDPAAPLPQLRITEFLAHNDNGRLDEEQSPEDWIEITNLGATEANLHGWSLTDDDDEPGQWVFPPVRLAAGARMLVYASGKDKRQPGSNLHTNFKLGVEGESLGLYSPDAPRIGVHGYANYAAQRGDISYGIDAAGKLGYFTPPTPLTANGVSSITNVVSDVYFSAKRGFYSATFNLTLLTRTEGAEIRYTKDGSEPSLARGFSYSGPIPMSTSTVIRASAFKPNHLSSKPVTHTYLFNLAQNRRYLPALSIATATNNLYGTNGIMEYSPRNTTKHGLAWERPVSVELIKPADNSGFQVDAGIRVAGGDYIRSLYNYRSGSLPESKYSFRLYFRSDYGGKELDYPFFENIPLDRFNQIHLRAGMNDHSNPFMKDEFLRTLQHEMGHVVAHGRFVNLFLNGAYKGYYNPTERYEGDFLQAWHGGGAKWDVIGAINQVVEGDAVAWNQLKTYVQNNNPTNPAVYLEFENRIDMVNLIDYLLPQLWADNDDWPHNNTRAAREKVPGAKWRFYIWDTEFSFGSHPVDYNTFSTIFSTSPPWGATDYQRMFVSMRRSPEFKLLFADRIHKHFFNGGTLTDENIRKVYDRVRAEIQPSISGFNSVIQSWINSRRRYLTNHFNTAGFLASSNAPVLNQFGGRVGRGFQLDMRAGVGQIYYTTNGTDPRVRFTGEVSPQAKLYTGAIPVDQSFVLKARTLNNTNWSAVSEAVFSVEQLGVALRISEIMYNPLGGDAYEYLELLNAGGTPIDLDGFTFDGVTFRFPEDTPLLQPGERLLLASDENPAAFATRYGSPRVAGYFGGSLNNAGEQLTIKNGIGEVITTVFYDDDDGWSAAADGSGHSLELLDASGDPRAAANWAESTRVNGSPGQMNDTRGTSGPVVLNELFADNQGAVVRGGGRPDFVEIRNRSTIEVNLTGWSLSDSSNPNKYSFPQGLTIQPGGYVVVWMPLDPAGSGLSAGFGLDGTRETVSLYNAERVRVDAITYGPQIADFSLGRRGDGSWGLGEPSPGTMNVLVQTAAISAVTLNEFLANAPVGQTDWIELFNSDTNVPVAIGGMYITQSNIVSRLPEHTFIPAGGYLKLEATELAGPLDLAFKLPAAGGVLILSDAAGAEFSRRAYTIQADGVSSGQLPDGTGFWTTFPTTPSPGAKNYLPVHQGPGLNEILAWNSSLSENGRTADWIEIYNPLATAFDLGGWGISLEAGQSAIWRFPAGTSIPGFAYIRIWADPAASPSTDPVVGYNLGVPLHNSDGEVHLVNPAGQALNSVQYGFQIPNMSIGLTGANWALLETPTPQRVNAPSAALAQPAGITFNEWMAAPLEGDDWFELHNTNTLAVQIGGMSLTDDPSTIGRTNTVLRALSFIGANGFVLLQADGEIEKGADHTAFSLNELTETLRLYAANGILVAELNYMPQQPGVSEGRFPDSGLNFQTFPNSATPGGPNGAQQVDQDRDGMPDDWERQYGFEPLVPSDAGADADGDGLSNLAEYQAGTDPRRADSRLSLIVLGQDETGTTRLRFRSEANRSYTVLHTDDLQAAEWETLTSIDQEPSGREVTVTDTQGNPDRVRFYRLVTPRRP